MAVAFTRGFQSGQILPPRGSPRPEIPPGAASRPAGGGSGRVRLQGVVTLKHWDANSVEGEKGDGRVVSRHTQSVNVSDWVLADMCVGS